MTNEEKESILKLRNEGKTYGEIAKMTGISRGSVVTLIRRESEKKTRRCPYCGKTLIQTEGHRQKKYCSDFCRRNDWMRRNATSLKRIEHTCKCCGKRFNAYESKHPSFCSRECFYNFRKVQTDGTK